MLGKLKIVLKIVTAFIVLAVILFGIYRREYLSQAIPVYMQYLQQEDKWEHLNTGIYAYYSPPLNRYFFIKNNKLVKLARYGNPQKIQYVKDLNCSFFFKIAESNNEIRCFLEKKEYLVEKKFDAVKRLIVYEKMFDGFADLGRCSDIKPLETLYYLIRMVREEDYDKLSYKIAYNKHYGYPVTVFDERLNGSVKIFL